MTKQVDSYKFVPPITKRVIKTWIKNQPPRPTPWVPIARPLADCTVALISSGGLALKTDRPFDQEGERQNPWWGDTSYRVIPAGTTAADIEAYHLHIDGSHPKQDINCLIPLQRLDELAASGEIGAAAPRHYSFMGYTPQPQKLIEESVPAILQTLQADAVNLVVLVPA